MSADAAIQGALTIAQSAPIQAPRAGLNVAAAEKAAKDFEAVFISQFMGEMFSGIATDGPFGGGQGEAMFRSLMMDEYGKQMAARGGFGLADSVKAALLKTQERPQ